MLSWIIKIGIVILILVILFFMRSSYERKRFVTEEFIIKTDKIRQNKTFVFITDLHNQVFTPDNKPLLEAVKNVQPDGILIGGDLMVAKRKKKHMENGTRIAENLVEKLVELCPVYYGYGNHETRMQRKKEFYGNMFSEYDHRLKKAGVIFLDNDTKDFSDEIRITGITLDRDSYKDFNPGKINKNIIEKKVGSAVCEKFQILLSHSPLHFEEYCKWGADLILSGHFHGGTIRIPLLGGVMTPQYQFFHKYCDGRFDRDKHTMIVGRGLGTHSIDIRFNNLPQLVVLRIEQS